MTLSGHVTKFRTLWEDRFLDAVAIGEDQAGAFNTTTGEYAAAADTDIYTGAALIRPTTSEPVTEMFAQQAINTSDLVVYVPHDTTGIRPGHQVAVTTSDDPDLQGAVLRVIAISRDGYITRRAALCRIDQESP